MYRWYDDTETAVTTSSIGRELLEKDNGATFSSGDDDELHTGEECGRNVDFSV